MSLGLEGTEAWEQIVSQPGAELDMRSHINTENALAWSPKLACVLRYLLLPQRPTPMLYKSRFYFSLPLSKTLQRFIYSWQTVAAGQAALGDLFPKIMQCFT